MYDKCFMQRLSETSDLKMRDRDCSASVGRIWELREQQKLTEAIEFCEEAAKRHPEQLIFPKIACDLALATGRPDEAGRWLLEMLLRMWSAGFGFFGEFAKRFAKVVSQLEPTARGQFEQRLRSMLEKGQVHRRFAARCKALLDPSAPDLAPFEQIPQAGRSPDESHKNDRIIATRSLTSDTITGESPQGIVSLHPSYPLFSANAAPDKLFEAAKEMEAKQPDELERQIRITPVAIFHAERNGKLFSYLIAFLERRERFEEALRLLEGHPGVRTPSLTQAGFLRVCRKLGKYGRIEQFLEENPTAAKTDIFNVLYELVYFYEAQNDLQRAREILERIEKLFPTQQPILQTLRNFFLRFGMFSDASRIDAGLAEIRKGSKKPPKFREAVAESSAEVYSDLEHQRQLAALSEVTNGISHELGQPITNIRYTIQLFRRQLEQNLKREVVFSVFDTVLRETERMGGLVKRLAPITSNRRVVESFDAVGRVEKRLETERARVSEHGIQVEINAKGPIAMQADPVRFDQLLSNLLLNALDALAGMPPEHAGKIRIRLSSEPGKRLRLVFEDNGPGIPAEHRRKIFEPFFTTKSPGSGEGLGLFIVWNLLKMQGGSISLDSTYRNGARFIVVLPTETKLPPRTPEP